jgi:hypothetical protein
MVRLANSLMVATLYRSHYFPEVANKMTIHTMGSLRKRIVIAAFAAATGTLQGQPQTVSHSGEASWEEGLHQRYSSFLKKLDAARIKADYPGAIRDIRSHKPGDQTRGLNVLGASGRIDAIPWIVPLLETENDLVRIHAGRVLEQIVSGNELLRRDMSQPEKIVLRPRSAPDVDLTPLAWPILRMMRAPDDGNTAAYAATMAGYLGLPELEGELRKLLKSVHPAVQRSATHALSMLGVGIDKENSGDFLAPDTAVHDPLSKQLTTMLFINRRFVAFTDLWGAWNADGDPIVFHADSTVDNEKAGLRGNWRVINDSTALITEQCLFSPIDSGASTGWYILLEADKAQWLETRSKPK